MNWFQKNFKTIIYASFLVPILTVAIVSISHVTQWYGISNPVSWAVYLSVGIEIAALSALAAISARMGRKVYIPFGIVTLIQFIGNIFFAYQYININGQSFKDWVDMVDPLVSLLGVESGNMIGHKRFLALFAGGMLPLISLSFLHMLVKFEEEEKNAEEVIDIDEISKIAGTIEKKTIEEEKYTPTEEDIKKIEEILLKKENHIITDENVGKTTKNTLIVEKEITNDINDSDSTIVGNIEEDVVQTVEEPKIKRLFYSKRDG